MFSTCNGLLDMDRRPRWALSARLALGVCLAPTSPKGHERNWIQSGRGKACFAYLCLYGPLPEPYFDKTWRVDQIE
jgi:hypothetical protein